MFRKFVFCLVVLSLSACVPAEVAEPIATTSPVPITTETAAPASPTASVTTTEPVPTETPAPAPTVSPGRLLADGRSVILTLAAGPEITWEPTEADIEGVEALLLAYVAGLNYEAFPYHSPLETHLPEYTRQFRGITVEDQPVLNVGYFCDVDVTELQMYWVMVDDGGDCYFDFNYNPATGEILHLTVNGDA
ncbi:MAG: hypothetical protein KDE28_29765 [Anaerolineales bacterium]|nr:hypothetical protein [Anaerolineales bacterium]